MEQSQERAMERVLAKISAMRKTLPTDEQDVLDIIVTGEVEGHRLSADKVTDEKTVAEKAAFSKSAAEKISTADDASEVELHRMDPKITYEKAAMGKSAVTKSAADKISAEDDASEVELHRMNAEKVSADKVSAGILLSDRSMRRFPVDYITDRVRIQ